MCNRLGQDRVGGKYQTCPGWCGELFERSDSNFGGFSAFCQRFGFQNHVKNKGPSRGISLILVESEDGESTSAVLETRTIYGPKCALALLKTNKTKSKNKHKHNRNKSKTTKTS